jgi:hypothetical protein
MDPLKMYLYRLERNDKGLLGVLVSDRMVDGEEEPTRQVLCCTFEMPGPALEPLPGCLVPGTYPCQRRDKTFEVGGVPGLVNPVFMSAQSTDPPAGHILLGDSFGALYGDTRAERNTDQGFKSFLLHAGHVDEFDLVVVDLSQVGGACL